MHNVVPVGQLTHRSFFSPLPQLQRSSLLICIQLLGATGAPQRDTERGRSRAHLQTLRPLLGVGLLDLLLLLRGTPQPALAGKHAIENEWCEGRNGASQAWQRGHTFGASGSVSPSKNAATRGPLLRRRNCSECDWVKVVDAASLLGTKLWVLTRPKGMRGERGYVICKTRPCAFLGLVGGAEAAARQEPER